MRIHSLPASVSGCIAWRSESFAVPADIDNRILFQVTDKFVFQLVEICFQTCKYLFQKAGKFASQPADICFRTSRFLAQSVGRPVAQAAGNIDLENKLAAVQAAD